MNDKERARQKRNRKEWLADRIMTAMLALAAGALAMWQALRFAGFI